MKMGKNIQRIDVLAANEGFHDTHQRMVILANFSYRSQKVHIENLKLKKLIYGSLTEAECQIGWAQGLLLFHPYYMRISYQNSLVTQTIYSLNNTPKFVGNKAKWRASKRVFQESKARQNFRKTNISYPGGKKCLFFRNFGVLCFLETPVLRLALLSYLLPGNYQSL